jgi:hypothetical protein
MCEDYPLYKNFYHFDKQTFRKLVNDLNPIFIKCIPKKLKYQHTIDKYNGTYLFIKENWDLNEELNNVTDYFSECIRIKCHFGNNTSPCDYWKKYRKQIKDESKRRFNKINEQFMRDTVL